MNSTRMPKTLLSLKTDFPTVQADRIMVLVEGHDDFVKATEVDDDVWNYEIKEIRVQPLYSEFGDGVYVVVKNPGKFSVSVERIPGADWIAVKDMACATMHLKAKHTEPTSIWKKKILLAEHSPIRALQFRIDMIDIPYFVSTHFVRHKFGVEHWVSSQREDRSKSGVTRDKLTQDAKVNHTMILNAQAIINISRKRLCHLAHIQTREVWEAVVGKLKEIGEVELFECCKPDCLYRGGRCYEMKGCGFCRSILDNEGGDDGSEGMGCADRDTRNCEH